MTKLVKVNKVSKSCQGWKCWQELPTIIQKQHIALNWIVQWPLHQAFIKSTVEKDLNLWRNVKRETKIANLLRQEPCIWKQIKMSLKTNWIVSETDLTACETFTCSSCFQWTKLVTKTQPVWVVKHGMGQNIVVPKNKPLETPWNRFRESGETTCLSYMLILQKAWTVVRFLK